MYHREMFISQMGIHGNCTADRLYMVDNISNIILFIISLYEPVDYYTIYHSVLSVHCIVIGYYTPSLCN